MIDSRGVKRILCGGKWAKNELEIVKRRFIKTKKEILSGFNVRAQKKIFQICFLDNMSVECKTVWRILKIPPSNFKKVGEWGILTLTENTSTIRAFFVEPKFIGLLTTFLF